VSSALRVVRSDCQENSQNRQLADQEETTVDDALVELREEKPAVLSLTLLPAFVDQTVDRGIQRTLRAGRIVRYSWIRRIWNEGVHFCVCWLAGFNAC